MVSATHAADPPSPPVVPPEITAMLLEHRGEWRSDGWISRRGQTHAVQGNLGVQGGGQRGRERLHLQPRMGRFVGMTPRSTSWVTTRA